MSTISVILLVILFCITQIVLMKKVNKKSIGVISLCLILILVVIGIFLTILILIMGVFERKRRI